jgi:Uma2 family endonuclease
MTTPAARTQARMTVGEFLGWSEEQADDARYELVAGVAVRLMAPTNIRHARIQRNVSEVLRGAIAAAGLPCEAFDAGPGVAVGMDGDECRIPDVVVTCASTIDEAAPGPEAGDHRRGGLAVDEARRRQTTRSSSTGASRRSGTIS